MPEKSPEVPPDPKLLKELEEIKSHLSEHDGLLKTALDRLQNYSQIEQKKRTEFFGLQRGLQDKISAAQMRRERRAARPEDKRWPGWTPAGRPWRRKWLRSWGRVPTASGRRQRVPAAESQPIPSLISQIQKLKYQLNLIGGIDPEAIKEYEETKNRHEFLETQTTDLRKAIEDLDKVIVELDATIKSRSETAFRNINREFAARFLHPLRRRQGRADPDSV